MPTFFISRRTFVKGLSGAALAGAATKVTAQQPFSKTMPKIQMLETRTISWQPEYYCGWPTLTRRQNGELLLVYSGGREAHVCPFGRVELLSSRDDGATWSWPRVLLDGPIDDRDAGVLETARGTLLVTFFTSLAYEAQLQAAQKKGTGEQEKWKRWQAVHQRLSDAERKAELGQWTIRSTDGGLTWSPHTASLVNSPHGPIQLSDGRLLYAGKELWTGEKRVGVCESRDDGQSWQWLATIKPRDGDSIEKYHELHTVESGDKIIIHIRNENPQNFGETLQCESNDGGRSWTIPHSIGVWGLPSFLLRLRDGRLLMTYGYRRAPFGNQARLSDDHGQTWSPPLIISQDGSNGDLGYPSTVQLADNTFLTVWYEHLAQSPQAVLRQARWKLEN